MAFVPNHGVQTQTANTSAAFVPVGLNNNIFLIGIADVSEINTLHLVKNKSDATFFGAENPAFTIPNALRVIQDIANCNVIVVNVFNSTSHTTSISAESVVVTNGSIPTSQIIYTLNSVKSSDGATTYILGTDYNYTVQYGIQIIAGGDLADGDAVKVDYTYVDPTKVQMSIIGGGTPGNYTGMNMIQDVLPTLGITPNFLCCPTYCKIKTIASAMSGFATSLNLSTVISHIISGGQQADITAMESERRGSSVLSGPFNIQNTRVDLHYGDWEIPSKAYTNQQYVISGDVVNIALAAFQETALSFGAGYSNVLHPALSNYTPIGVLVDNSNPVVLNGQGYNNNMNLLNGIGINCLLTIPNYGTVVWGGINSAYNTALANAPFTFSNIQRSTDIIERLCATAVLTYVDYTDDFDVIFEGAKELMDSVLSQAAQLKVISNNFRITLDPVNNTPATQANGIMYIIVTASVNTGIRDFRIQFNINAGNIQTSAA